MREPLEWPSWWPGCRSVRELAPGDDERVGARYGCEWHGRIPFPVRFEFEVEEVSAPKLMRGHAAGVVNGTGTWRLFEEDEVTALTYEWRVRLTAAWIRAVPQPLLEANHDWVMRQGRQGLARRLPHG